MPSIGMFREIKSHPGPLAGKVIWVIDQPNSSISGGYNKGNVCTIMPLLAA